MLLPATPQFRRKRGGPRKATNIAPPGPAPLTLVSAFYTYPGAGDGPTLTLQFSRAINVDLYQPSAFPVRDAQNIPKMNYLPDGGGTFIDPQTIEFTLVATTAASGSGVHFSASAANGIVAEDDGTQWAGTSEIALPFP